MIGTGCMLRAEESQVHEDGDEDGERGSYAEPAQQHWLSGFVVFKRVPRSLKTTQYAGP